MHAPVQGELTRHHDKPFYAQPKQPKFFWAGCLAPVVLVVVIGFFVIQGLTTETGLATLRAFILLVIVLALIQLIFGGTIFARTRSSLGKGLLIGGSVMILLLLLALIGAASVLSSFLQ